MAAPRVALVLLGLFWGLLAGLAPVARALVPPGSHWSEAYFPSGDGTVLHADVLRPAGLPADARTPVILWVGPYANHSGAGPASGEPMPFDPTRSGPHVDGFEWLWERGRMFERGYSLVAVDSRGFGASGGCWDFGGPGEQADANAAVAWAASAPWSNGRVGMIGHSYPAFFGLMAAAQRVPGLAAIALSAGSAAIDQLMASNGVHYGADYLAGLLYSAGNPQPGTLNDDQAYHAAWAGGLRPDCGASVSVESLWSNPATDFYRARDIRSQLAASRVPVLYAHGFLDTRVKPSMWISWLPQRTAGVRVWLGQWGHGSPHLARSGREGWGDEVFALFERELKSGGSTEPTAGAVIQEGPSGKFRDEAQWPPTDGLRFTLPLLSGSYLDEHGNSGETLPPTESPSSQLGITGHGSWTFTAPLADDHHLAGIPHVGLEGHVTDRAVIVALLYDVAPDGTALLVTRGAARWSSGKAQFDLHPQDWRFVRGHRLGVLLSGGDGEYWLPLDRSHQRVEVSSGALSLPFLERERTVFGSGKPGPDLAAKKPITIDQTTIEARTRSGALEPPPQLSVAVSPRRIPRGRARELRVTVTAPRDGRLVPVQQATVQVGASRALTDALGAAQLRVRLRRTATVRASIVDLRPGQARIIVYARRSARKRGGS